MVNYANNPSSEVCQTQQCFHNIFLSPEDLESNPSCWSASTHPKPLSGGLSYLFATSVPVNNGNDELRVLTDTHGENIDEFSDVHCCSPVEDQSPVSVLRGPFSRSSSSSGGRNSGYHNSFELGGKGVFDVSCVGNGFEKCSTLGDTGTKRCFLRGLDGFNIGTEGDFTEESNRPEGVEDQGFGFSLDPILYNAQMEHIIFKEELIVRAFHEVKKAHSGQVEGEIHSCLQHCTETAKLLATIGSTATVVAAGLLHHILDDTSVGYDYILHKFGKEVADLVEGVSRLTHVSKLVLQSHSLTESVQVDRLRAMLLRMVDVRVVLIELAHRLHGMTALATLPFSEQQRKKLRVDEIHDIQGLRLIVDTEEDCFAALDVIHRLWPEVPQWRKDYINCPKLNGYRSLHTVILGDDMIPMEVQIRSSEMHAEAELGLAAHWRYKEADSKLSSFILEMIERARTELMLYCNTDASLALSFVKPIYPCPEDKQYLSSCDQDDPILVVIVESAKIFIALLPAECTIMDLCERINHGSFSNIYKEGVEISLNGRIFASPNRSCLRMGDVVELMPSVNNKKKLDGRW